MTEETRARSTTGDLLVLIEQLAGFDRVGVTRLARHLEVPAPTVYRMLRALERAGYVEQLAESKEYRLTLKLFELGSRVASRTTLRDLAAVEMERLAQQTGLASNVSVLVDRDVLYLAQVKTEELLAVNLTPGSRAPATCTAMGKAMLSVCGDVRSVAGPGPYPSRTAYTITTYEDLTAELATIQRLGYAVDRQELNLGVWCVAAPILGVRQTRPAAVSVSVYRPELDAAEEERLGRLRHRGREPHLRPAGRPRQHGLLVARAQARQDKRRRDPATTRPPETPPETAPDLHVILEHKFHWTKYSFQKESPPVRLAALYTDGTTDPRLHLAVDGGFAPVETVAAAARRPNLAGLRDVGDLYARGADAVADLRAIAPRAQATVAPEGIRYAPPVLRPGKIICVGLNYADHIAESRGVAPDRIVLFAKFPSCLIGHQDQIRYPAVTTQLDYEGELAVVIGRTASNVGVEEALDYVGGYTIVNDVSARDLQGSEPQWIRGKALDTFAPLGPVVLDAAAAPPVAEMRLRTLVNGDVRQDASCAQMITGVPELSPTSPTGSRWSRATSSPPARRPASPWA